MLMLKRPIFAIGMTSPMFLDPIARHATMMNVVMNRATTIATAATTTANAALTIMTIVTG